MPSGLVLIWFSRSNRCWWVGRSLEQEPKASFYLHLKRRTENCMRQFSIGRGQARTTTSNASFPVRTLPGVSKLPGMEFSQHSRRQTRSCIAEGVVDLSQQWKSLECIHTRSLKSWPMFWKFQWLGQKDLSNTEHVSYVSVCFPLEAPIYF